jgi:sulfite reductase (NADPH) flavoprotein alpha-component
MHFQKDESAGPGGDEQTPKTFVDTSSSLPFGQHLSLDSITGPTYLTAQTLVQQVAYTLSDKIFAYSVDSFDLDVAVQYWQQQGEKNAFGYEQARLPWDTSSPRTLT